jgi:hypothetical protein
VAGLLGSQRYAPVVNIEVPIQTEEVKVSIFGLRHTYEVLLSAAERAKLFLGGTGTPNRLQDRIQASLTIRLIVIWVRVNLDDLASAHLNRFLWAGEPNPGGGQTVVDDISRRHADEPVKTGVGF